MIILCGCWRTFIRFWKSSTHSWGQLELRLDWKVNSITSCARGGWRMKGTWWRSQRAEILWIMITLAWVGWSGKGRGGGVTVFNPWFCSFFFNTQRNIIIVKKTSAHSWNGYGLQQKLLQTWPKTAPDLNRNGDGLGPEWIWTWTKMAPLLTALPKLPKPKLS